MKRIFALFACGVLLTVGVALADSPEDQFVEIYNAIQQADSMAEGGRGELALRRYWEAQTGLKKLEAAFPNWNERVIRFRLKYVSEKIAPLAAKFPNLAPVPAPAPMKTDPATGVDKQISLLNDEIIRLRVDRAQVEAKLKEALSAKPATVDPVEMARATEKITALEKENSLLKVSRDQDQKKMASLVDPKAAAQAQKDLADANRKLASQTAALNSLTADHHNLQKRLKEKSELPALRAENQDLKRQVGDLNKKVATLAKVEDLSKQLAQSKTELKAQQTRNEGLSKETQKLERLLNDPSFQPGATSPQLSTMEKELAAVQKEKAALAKDKSTLEARLREMAAVPPKNTTGDAATLKQLEQERAALQAENITLGKEKAKLEMLLTDPALQIGAPAAKGSAAEKELTAAKKTAKANESARAALQKEKTDLERENQALESRLKAAQAARKGKGAAAKPDALMEELTANRARLEALEAKSVPYTTEELALFKNPAPTLVAKLDTKPAKKSAKELPAGTAQLAAEAQRAFSAGRYDEAEQKYLQVLRQDENNVAVLANLAAIQIEQNRYPEAEANLNKALAGDPDDSFSVYKLGYLKFRQQKFDDALSALSRAAQLDPKNSEIQNYLGITLSEKGQRGPAEAALRKSIQLAPRNPDAHHNLAVIYATQKPPSLELARWHYQKSLDVGHAKNPDLEKILEEK